MRTPPIGLALAFAALTLQAQSAPPRPDFSETRRLLRDAMAKDSVTAAAMAVVRDGAILWEEGFGTATPRTPFQLASLSKTIEATLAAVLAEQRSIDLDRPVNEYLRTTGVSSPVWDVRGTTLRRLLMHTGGLSTFNLGCNSALPPSQCAFPSADEIIRQYGIIAQDPGTAFDYSNLGYFVAGEAMARAAGSSLGELLRGELFRPLGMADASLEIDGARLPGGLASAHDLALFAAFHLKAHRKDQRAILTDAAIDSMQLSSQEYGLGWWTEANRFGYRSVLGQGGNDRAQAWLRLIPSERVAVVLLINRGVGFGETVSDAALATVLPRYAEGLAARARTAQTSTPAPAAPTPLDSTIVGDWTGRVRTADTDVPLELTIAANGAVQARIGNRTDAGTARVSSLSGRLLLRIAGDLEAPNPAGITRAVRFYLKQRGSGFGGHVTTRPPSATGLDGDVTYWAEISRRP